jgi:hypothetical protein
LQKGLAEQQVHQATEQQVHQGRDNNNQETRTLLNKQHPTHHQPQQEHEAETRPDNIKFAKLESHTRDSGNGQQGYQEKG